MSTWPPSPAPRPRTVEGPSPESPAPAGDEPPSEPPAEERHRWRPSTAPAAVVSALIGSLIAGFVVAAIAAAAGAEVTRRSTAVVMIGQLVQDLVFVGTALLYAALAGRPRAWQFGLRRARPWRAVGWVAAAAVATYAFNFAYSQTVHATSNQEVVRQLGGDRGPVALILVAALVTVVAPIAEEFLFRGYVFTALRNWRGPWVAAVLTGLVFGAIHFSTPGDVPFLVPLAFFGFLLCIVRWRTGSLYPCFALHALNNGIAFAGFAHWTAGQAVALVVGDWVVIGLITGPFAVRWRRATA